MMRTSKRAKWIKEPFQTSIYLTQIQGGSSKKWKTLAKLEKEDLVTGHKNIVTRRLMSDKMQPRQSSCLLVYNYRDF